MFYKKFSEIKVGFFVFVAVVLVTSTIFGAKGFIVGKDKRTMIAYFTSVRFQVMFATSARYFEPSGSPGSVLFFRSHLR